jgi:hypothetical protein
MGSVTVVFPNRDCHKWGRPLFFETSLLSGSLRTEVSLFSTSECFELMKSGTRRFSIRETL